MITIRHACLEDAVKVRDLALSRCVKSSSGERTGLVDYEVPSLNSYSLKTLSEHFLVAEDGKDLVGFSDAYNAESMERFYSNSEIVNGIKVHEKRPFIYWNTLVLKKGFEGRGLPEQFFSHLLDYSRANNSPVWCCAVHEPLKNEISARMLTSRLGFLMQTELVLPSITFGLYKRKLE